MDHFLFGTDFERKRFYFFIISHSIVPKYGKSTLLFWKILMTWFKKISVCVLCSKDFVFNIFHYCPSKRWNESLMFPLNANAVQGNNPLTFLHITIDEPRINSGRQNGYPKPRFWVFLLGILWVPEKPISGTRSTSNLVVVWSASWQFANG